MLEGDQPAETFDPGLIDQEITDFVTPRQNVLASLVGASVPITPGEETAFYPEELEITVGRDLWRQANSLGTGAEYIVLTIYICYKNIYAQNCQTFLSWRVLSYLQQRIGEKDNF